MENNAGEQEFINVERASTADNNVVVDQQPDIPNAMDTNGLPQQQTESTASVGSDDEWLDILGSGSIMKKLVKSGDPETRPQRLQKCTVNYQLKLLPEHDNDDDDDEAAAIETKNDFDFQLGDCEVVQGLDVAVGLMNVREKCRLKIDARLGYGSKGLSPHVPPNATLVYDIELIKVEDADEPESLTITQRKFHGNKKRERGNWWYGRGEHTLAIQCYRRALDYLDEVETTTTPSLDNNNPDNDVEALQDLLEDRISVCNNMAAAQIKLDKYEPALTSLRTVLACQPNNVKALYRKAKIHRVKNDLQAALACLKRASQVAVHDDDIQKEIQTINQLIQKQNDREREVARRMFSGNNDNNGGVQKDGFKKKKIDNNNGNFMKWGTTIGITFAVGLLSVAAYRLKFN